MSTQKELNMGLREYLRRSQQGRLKRNVGQKEGRDKMRKTGTKELNAFFDFIEGGQK